MSERGIMKFINYVITFCIYKWTFGNSVAYIDLYIFKGNNFLDTGMLSIKVHHKPANRYVYIPYKSAHTRQKIGLRSIKTIRQDKY